MQSIFVSISSSLASFAPVFASRESSSQLVSTDGVVYVDDVSLKAAFDGVRDYTTVILLTSESGRVNCQFCNVLGPDFRAVATSYDMQLRKTPDAKRELFFMIAEPENSLELFKSLGSSHVPNVAIYTPTKSKSEAKQGVRGPHSFLSFKSQGDQKDYLVSQMAHLGFKITSQKPFPSAKMVKTVATAAAGGIGLFVFRKQASKVWQSKQIWLAFSLMCIIMFISGHMFNVTRGRPFMHNDNGQLRSFEPGFSSQVAVETQILAVVYASLAFTTIGLLKFVPKLDSVQAQSIAAAVGAAIIYVVYSLSSDIFKTKMGDFISWSSPFRLI